MESVLIAKPGSCSNKILRRQLLEVMAYFDVFKHPLHRNEIAFITGADEESLNVLLQELTAGKVIFCSDHYFSMDAAVETLLGNRKICEERARAYLQKLEKYTKIIASFPFVRGIAVSGSLSKGIMHKDGDIDFFIITRPGRLWICRTLLIAYKKFRLLNSRKYFCLNYFVDENNLEIRDKNIFTFMELLHLMPVFSEGETLQKFFKANEWMKEYFPSFQTPVLPSATDISLQKSGSEKLFSGILGNRLEKMAHIATLKRWRKKFAHFNAEKFELTMRSTVGVSKHHPRDFQSRVLLVYEDKLNQLLNR